MTFLTCITAVVGGRQRHAPYDILMTFLMCITAVVRGRQRVLQLLLGVDKGMLPMIFSTCITAVVGGRQRHAPYDILNVYYSCCWG